MRTTFILDTDGMPVDLEDVKEGKFEAYLGPAMTMSLPPQAFPYVVIVQHSRGMQSFLSTW